MTEKPVISDTSPLIGLSKLNLLTILRDLYIEVWILREVENEFLALDETIRREILNDAPWIKTIDLVNFEEAMVYSKLDAGETEVLTLAYKYDARLVIIDEQKARQEAKKIGLPSIGTVGILLEAKKEGLIVSIKPLLMTLQNNNMHLSDSLIAYALTEAGEHNNS